MTNLTGLELNLYERAGYVVRRGAFDAAASGDGTPDEVMAMCTDILGMEVDAIPFETRSPSGWIRASGTAIEARDTELAPLQDAS